MFGFPPGAKRVVSLPPQPWIRFNDSPTPLESPLAHQQASLSSSHQYNPSSSSSSSTYNNNHHQHSQHHHSHSQQQPQQNQPTPQQHQQQQSQSKVSSLSPSLSDNFSPNENNNNVSNGIELANFDYNVASIEKDPKILHPVPVRVSPDGQLISYDSNSSSSSSRSSNGLTNLPPGADRKGAFTVYRKSQKDHHSSTKSRESMTSSTTKESNKWLDVLKAKYHPPKPVQMPRSIYDLFQNKELVDYIQDLQERSYRLETMNNELIHKMANLMEDQSYFHHHHHHSHSNHHVDYKRLSK